MKGTSFALCALASLVVHLGLGAAVTVRLHFHHDDEAAHAGASSAAATSGPAALGGETFDIQDEVPSLDAPPEEAPATSGDPAASAGEASSAPASVGDAPASPDVTAAARAVTSARASRSIAAGRPQSRAAREAAPSPSPSPSPPPAVYGAVGDRAASDLVVTFKRAFPQAGSSDPTWNQVPVGFFAEGDVTFLLSEGGALTSARVSPSAAPAFRAAITRTVTLIKGRAFTARGAETRLHMRVHVSDRLTNHGAFTIDAAGSFELPSGRRVAVTITER